MALKVCVFTPTHTSLNHFPVRLLVGKRGVYGLPSGVLTSQGGLALYQPMHLRAPTPHGK